MRDSAVGPSAADLWGLVTGLAFPEDRAEAADILARALGGDELLLFASDPELGVPLPAPGLPQTLRGAGEWKRFLQECGRRGCHEGSLTGLRGGERRAAGCAAAEGTAVVLLGESVELSRLESIRPALPLLGALFRHERQVDAAGAQARMASEAMGRARSLTQALQTMRAHLEAALAQAEEARTEARLRAEHAEALASELQAQAVQLEEQAVELEQLNDELAARTEDAELARAAAEQANRAKSDFMANMSHELRTPINAIIGYTQLVEMGLAGPVTPEQRAHLQRIWQSSDHLLSLVNDILDLAKVEAGQMTVERNEEPAQAVIEDALALVEGQARLREIAIEPRPCAPGASFVGDRDRVRQILLNLLTNAVKFTEPGGRVRVHCRSRNRADDDAQLPGGAPWLCIAVEDSGIGIAPEDLQRIFQPFVQAQSGHSRRHQGTGLGLTISRQLARLMGGDLTVQSQRGQGSVFTLWLPTSAPVTGALDESIRVGVRDGPGAWPPTVAEVGEALQTELPGILRRFTARVRADPDLPAAAGMDDSEILDHAPTFIADVARLLVKLGRTRPGPGGLKRETQVQRLVSHQHGADRARRGWSAQMLRREFGVLRSEMAGVVRQQLPLGADRRGAARLLDQLLRAALRASLRARDAAAAGSEPPAAAEDRGPHRPQE